MKTADLARLQAAHCRAVLDAPTAARRSVEDIRREHDRAWRSNEQHWLDIAVLLEEIEELQATLDEVEDLTDAEHAYAAAAEESA